MQRKSDLREETEIDTFRRVAGRILEESFGGKMLHGNSMKKEARTRFFIPTHLLKTRALNYNW